ncbi:dicarboxylate diiron protein [Perilla frutescens var. hirtella]|nr:dicarboxylate diiron protein [Perilla frutescens var. frutescens]KAH6794860.1 dicarboxylate diiron protein [Perilla frutescens var. hirtella]
MIAKEQISMRALALILKNSIIETNRTTARIFPAVLDVENPEFKRKLDRMVEINEKLLAVGDTDDIPLVENLKRIPSLQLLHLSCWLHIS